MCSAFCSSKPTLPYGSNNSIFFKCAIRSLFPNPVTYLMTGNSISTTNFEWNCLSSNISKLVLPGIFQFLMFLIDNLLRIHSHSFLLTNYPPLKPQTTTRRREHKLSLSERRFYKFTLCPLKLFECTSKFQVSHTTYRIAEKFRGLQVS